MLTFSTYRYMATNEMHGITTTQLAPDMPMLQAPHVLHPQPIQFFTFHTTPMEASSYLHHHALIGAPEVDVSNSYTCN